MRLVELPPVGERILADGAAPAPEFPGYQAMWLDSGTAALAVALQIAKSQRPELIAPEAIVPAYGCPDLVAACVYAGVKARLVDIQGSDPGYDLDALSRGCGENTLAVIAVNFLGIRERLPAIRDRIPPRTWLIEDNAQWFPELSSDTELEGDLVITSFGRGKPASILGGGLLLLRSASLREPAALHSILAPIPTEIHKPGARRAKIQLYNLLRNPFLYFGLTRVPALKLGETHYHALNSVHQLPPALLPLIGANIERWLARGRELEHRFDTLVGELQGLESLAVRLEERRKRLLRYPLLYSTKRLRDKMYATLQAEGLGSSLMYRQPLLTIPGVRADVLAEAGYPGATEFAGRLLTLPLHGNVSEKRFAQMAELLAGN